MLRRFFLYPLVSILTAFFSLQAQNGISVGKKSMPSVVSIAVMANANDEDALKNRMAMMILAPRRDLFGAEILNPPRKIGALGSGFVIRHKGKSYIVTNHHTVENAIKIKVTLYDERVLDATLKGFDSGTDLAVLEIKTKAPLPGLTWADSHKIQLGQQAYALGNAYGLGPTLTAGVVSSSGRDLSDPSLGFASSQLINKFIQTDASINRGNSGGPLVDNNGDVIGVNFAILTSSGGSDGVGLAIPANMAKKIVENIIDFGQVKRAWLGLSVQGVTKEIADSLGLTKPWGALVVTVTDNGPAKQSGLKSRDVILKINKIRIKDAPDVSRTIGQMAVGETVILTVWRDGQEKELQAVLQEFQSHEDFKTTIKTSKNNLKSHVALNDYDMGLTELTWQFRQRFNAENPAINGVLISDVKEGGWAEKNGIMVGDIILEINGIPVSKTDDIPKYLGQSQNKKPALLYLYRMGQKIYVGLRKKKKMDK
jgi:serine protease Do